MLLLTDENLNQKHIEMMNNSMLVQEAFVGRFIQDGVLHFPHGKDQLRKLITACWIVANNWLSFSEINGEIINSEKFTEGVELIWAILTPYLVINVDCR